MTTIIHTILVLIAAGILIGILSILTEPYIQWLRAQRPKRPDNKSQWAWRPPKYHEHEPPSILPPEDNLLTSCHRCKEKDVFESRHGQWVFIWPKRHCKIPARPGGWIKLDDSK